MTPPLKNRLVGASSPYLQQHAENPVHWQPWDAQALDYARANDKPILLSIGYSACHWCHVMAHESFEDAEVAAVMNRLFVNIKVDREERPDLDQIYQTAHQMLTRRAGGWPLTMFLSPDGTPFFGGTYFPKAPRYGLPGFADLCERVAVAYAEKRAEIVAQADELRLALADTVPEAPAPGISLDGRPLEAAAAMYERGFDRRYGGFGGAPKFPHPSDLAFLLRRSQSESREIGLFTLRRMAEGGIYDQLGGGFCRYSVDERWEIPHFEKMLYDNGPLLGLCADAWALTGDRLYEDVVRQTAAWVMREMQGADGGFFSSLDADSEGEEGKFYVWDRNEVQRLLAADAWEVAKRGWGLDGPPNFEGSHWHLRVAAVIGESARPMLEQARECLFAARELRVRPGRDEKVLTSWNALMIEGMAHAARAFGEAAWLNSARRAMDFVKATLWRDGRLLATARDGHARLDAYLDDHAFLLSALLELMQAEFRPDDLAFAVALADTLLERFEDKAAGGFFFTSHDHEALIHRPKSGHDNATPSGNGVAAYALQRLGHVVGDSRYLVAAEKTLNWLWADLIHSPGGFGTLLLALEEALTPPEIIVLRGPASDLPAWRRALRADPGRLVLAIPNGTSGLPLTLIKPESAEVNAWVCRGVSCSAPIGRLEELQ